MQVTFKQLRYFIAAAQYSSVSEAARILCVSQPSISTAITQLEDQLQQVLFLRGPGQPIKLTDAGRFAYERALELQRQMEAFCQETLSFDGDLKGEITLGGFKDLAPFYLPGLIATFRERHRDVQVKLFEGDQMQMIDALHQGELDLALCYDLGEQPLLSQQVLTALAPYAMLSAEHPLAAAESVSLSQLAQEPLIVENLPRTREYFDSLFARFNLTAQMQLQTSSFEMQRGLVAAGQGVALSCTRPKGDLSYDGSAVCCLPLLEKIEPERVVLAHLTQVRQTRLVRDFSACAQDYFAAL
ncbi:MAG: LysR substrate-binding domain-containing protein [Pseudomonadales bacterium]